MTRCRVYLMSKLSKFLPDVLAEPARFYFWRFLRRLELPGVTPTLPAKKAEGREFRDCYCVEIGLCWAPRSRMIDRISPTIRNEPVTRIQPRPRANADARITAWRGCESSSAARSSSSAKRRSSPGAQDGGAGGRSRAVQLQSKRPRILCLTCLQYGSSEIAFVRPRL
jgi:hypothetical protein